MVGIQRHVKALLRAGANPTVSSHDGMTPLHLAARARQGNIVGQLLEAPGMMVNAEDHNKSTPLYYACRSGIPEIVRLLIAAGADFSGDEWRKCLIACAEHDSETALWKTNTKSSRTETTEAAGLTLDDVTRPQHVVSTDNRTHLDPYTETARLDEIIDILVEIGGAHHRSDLSLWS